ncbi:glycoside hydrolase family 5 protein [Agromyces sp. NPDC058136]|uniref:glycoside hydrolase family 5 protein n=1 Tax=Agromyces sp. NPDC058136 TaxID=3346354 RepID=UPI0036DB1E0B
MQRRTLRVAVGLTTAALAISVASPVYAATPEDPIPVLTGPELAASWTAPLSTVGRYIVDANGDRFKLESANWDGAQGHWTGNGDKNDPANHNSGISYDIPMGLDRVPMATLMSDFHALGLNSIRLSFSNEMLGMTAPVPDVAVDANPELLGKTPLEVFDAVVEALTADGFAVILNNHTTTSRWCCGNDGNTKWYSSQTTEKWISDWVMLTERYADNPRVVGMDLRNEVRRDTWNDPNWGWGDGNDLYQAFQKAGIAIQQTNPDVLVIMEGINWVGIPTDITHHERPLLKPVANLSNALPYTDKLVYAAHIYGFTGPYHTGGTGLSGGETHDARYRDMTADELKFSVTHDVQFVNTAGQHYTAPVWFSEFGTTGAGQTNEQEKAWWVNFTDILIENDSDFAAWPLVAHAKDDGTFVDSFSLLAYKADGTKLSIADDWRYPQWVKLVNADGKTGQVDSVPRWNMIGSGSFVDSQSSMTMLQRPDWSPGQWKGTCPDTQRLQGIARSTNRGLCTDIGGISTSNPRVQSGEGNITNDWASGYSKLQCNPGEVAVGYSLGTGGGTKAAMWNLLCATSTTALPASQGRLIWFDQGDNRPAGGGSTASDWAPGNYKGQCKDTEYIAGVAFTYRWNHGGVPDALLCKPLR